MADVFGRRGFGRTIAYALTVLLWALLAVPAAASGPAPPSSSAGGAASTPAPRVTAVQCVQGCEGVRRARPGSLVKLRGRNLGYAETVVFLGLDGAQDDVHVEPAKVRGKYAHAQVPRRARTGPVGVITADGLASRPSRSTLDIVLSSSKRSAGPIDVEVSAHKIFFDGTRAAAVSFMVKEPSAIVVELLRTSDGGVVYRWDVGPVAAGEPRTVTWDGTAGGKVQAEGRYEFRVVARNADGAVKASTSQAGETAEGEFLFLRHKFPVRGPHDYGEFAASFGGGRNHQGQDVFAKCGTPLVAARGGTVKIKQTHSRAGHYVVIDGEATDVDYVYMHLREAALVDKGQRVRTGQLIGYVGDTGRAHGCHLHFELWSGPGWYSGGSPFDPLPQLQSWDRTS